ncbi:MAG TPA: ABC transporter permease subunit [Thermomicrobiales bacterium]|nr:ABC transporter permease subunit [Thermomicrobiales bacterium]
MSAVARMTTRVLGRGLAGFVALLLGLAFFEAVQAPIIGSIGGARGLAMLMNALPPALLAFTRTRPEFIAMSGLEGYLALGFTHPLYIVLTAAAVVGFAARSLAGEIERGTMQIALARPVSRPAVYASRVAGMAAVCLALAIVGPLGMVGGLLIVQPDGTLHSSHLWPLAVGSMALFWAIGGLTLFGSAAASTSGRVVGWAIGALLLSYFIDYFSGVWRVVRPLDIVSIFHYYDPSGALVHGSLAPRDPFVLFAAGLAGVLAGLAVFTRRDLPG